MTEKTILRRIDEVFDGASIRWEKNREDLFVYSRGGNPFKDVIDKGLPATPPFYFKVSQALWCAGYDHALAMLDIYKHKGDGVVHLCKAYEYIYWMLRIEQRGALVYGAGGIGLSFADAVESLSFCMALGWVDKTEHLVNEIYVAYSNQCYSDVRMRYSNPLAHWLLRIFFDYYGLQFDGWGKGVHGETEDIYAKPECFCEPMLNELFEHWRDADLSGMSDHLIWLCDYYTHRTCDAEGMEFRSDLLQARFPALILAWFRLRENLGLSIPVIDHPLMQAEYATLPLVQAPYTDDLLKAVLERLRREEMPGLGNSPEEYISVKSDMPKKRWFSTFFNKD